MSTTTTGDAGGGRGFQEAVSYAVGHRIRVEILTALHDLGSASANELARIVHEPLSTVTHHVNELLKSGAIRVERTERVRSVDQRFYTVLNPVLVSDDEMDTLTEEDRLELCRVVLQGLVAEALSSFWAGKLHDDPRLFLTWAWLNVDAQGRAEIAEEQLESWKRIREIEKRAEARCAGSGEEAFSVIASAFSFPRARTAPHHPDTPDWP